MEKNDSIKAFFKALKISLKNYSIYDKNHPSYIKSIQILKTELDRLFNFFDRSIQIGFSPDTVFFQKEPLKNEKLYTEVAQICHLRKLKTLEIKPAVTSEELDLFLSKLFLPRQDIFKSGGIKKLVEKERISNIKIQELDYSQLLKGEGEEIKDLWTYLLKEAAEEKNEQKMKYLSDNCELIYDKVSAEEILLDKKLSESFKSFFSYLIKNKKKEYASFSKNLIKSALSSKQIPSKEKIDDLKHLIKDLNEKDLASTLWEEITSKDDFNEVSFQIFSDLVEEEKHHKIAESLSDVFKRSASDKRNEKTIQKIRNLLSCTSSPYMSEIYKKPLQTLLEDISAEKSKKVSFDESHLKKNYQLILLNLLEKEKDKKDSSRLLKTILDEWEYITEKEDIKYLKQVYETIDGKKDVLSSLPDFEKLESAIMEFIEEMILKGELSLHFDYFIEHIGRSTKDENKYLEKIFTEEVITPYILKAFFRFFTGYLFYFNVNLEQRSGDDMLLQKITENLSLIDSPISLVTLKSIFKLGTNNIKVKALKAMRNLTEHDDKFLFPLLKKKNYDLKKEAFALLARNESSKFKALDLLFSFRSPLGIMNKRLCKHIRIVDELEARSARGHLISLAGKKFIWNKNLRNQAKRVLRKWDDRESQKSII